MGKRTHRIVEQALKELKVADSPLLKELWDNNHPGEMIDPTDKEYISWKNSLPVLLERILNAGLGKLDIFFEYDSVTISERMDALLVGFSKKDKKPSLVIFELKQWDKISDPKHLANPLSLGHSEVILPEDPKQIPRSHPLYQLEEYTNNFSVNAATAGKDIDYYKIAFLHNFSDLNILTQEPYSYWKKYSQELYGKNDYKKLEDYLKNALLPQPNSELTSQLAKANYTLPTISRNALNKALHGKKFATMINDQVDIEKNIVKKIRDFRSKPYLNNLKEMIVVKGAPGTGKTVIGLQLLSDCMNISGKTEDSFKNSPFVFCIPRSRIIHEVIKKETGLDVPYDANVKNHRSVIIVDEAHRITNVEGELSNLCHETTPDFLILLQDDHQCILPNEEGTVDNLKKFADRHKMAFDSYTLNLQKRSGFLEHYIENIDELLYGDSTKAPFKNNNFNMGIFASPTEMLKRLKQNAQNHKENRNKLLASFDWPWNHRDADVTIGNFKKAWNPMVSEQADWYLAQGSTSVEKKEIDKIGCIYTAQGLEYDNVGLIWGKDFVWDKQHNQWKLNICELKDNKFKNIMASDQRKLDTMKNIYRVLLTRATKGLGIYFLDKDTEEHVRNFFDI